MGFIVSNRGIEANLDKIRALSQLATPTNLKQIQKLTGCVAALSRFIPRLGEKALPLYRLLRRTEHFEWTDTTTAGLEEIKALFSTNPILAAPNVGEPMLLYIAATHQHYKKYTSMMIRVCHSRSRFLSCMYIHEKFMTESR